MRQIAAIILCLFLVSPSYALPPTPPLPAQSGNSGKYLTTDGTVSSWSTSAAQPVDAFLTSISALTPTTGCILLGGATDTASCYAMYTENGWLLKSVASGSPSWTKAIAPATIGTIDNMTIGSVTPAAITATSIEAPYAIFGTAATAADIGNIRLPNNTNIAWELAATGTDVLFGVSSADDIVAALVAATDLFKITTGNLFVGAGTPTQTQDGADVYITGMLEVDGAIYADGGITAAASTDPFVKFDETDGTDWWIGLDDTGNSMEFRTNSTVGNSVQLELEEDGDLVVTGDTTVTGADITLAAAGVKLTGSNGSLTILGLGDGQDEDVKIDLNTTANTIEITSPASSASAVDFNTLNLITTGTISGAIPMVSDSDNHTITSAEAYGYLLIATGAGTWTAPAAVAGMSWCLLQTGADEVIIDVDAGDHFVYEGAAESAGERLDSDATAGEYICAIAIDVDTWYVMGHTSGWTGE